MDNKFIQIIKNKWLRSIALTILLIVIIVCAYIGINILVEKANLDDIDFTKDKIYSISQETKDKLSNLDTDVTISIYNMYQYLTDFAYKYTRLNEHIKVEELDNLTAKTSWKTDYGVDENSSFVVISTGNKEKLINSYEFYTYDYTTYREIDITEEVITNGILDLTITEKPKIYFLTGHNLYADNYFQYLKSELIQESNEVENLDLMTAGKVPEDCNALVITALKEDIKEPEKDALIKYIHKGGKILLMLDPNLDGIKLTNFQKVLDEFGISVSKGVLLEGDTNKMVSGSPNFIITRITPESDIVNNANMDFNACFINAGKLIIAESDVLEKGKLTTETLAVTTDKAFYRTDLYSSSQTKIDSDEDAPSTIIAAIMKKEIDENTTAKVVAFANTGFATNSQIQVSSQYYLYALDFYNNKDIVLNSISYLTEREENITIRKNSETVNYDVTEAQNRIVLAVIFTVPALIVAVGITVWILRRRKK